MIVYKPPTPLPTKNERFTLFLAGSIEQGIAADWQQVVQSALSPHDVCVLNPRRDAWDPSWVQSIENPEFKYQVEWELKGIMEADLVLFYIDPSTKSPITLLELGLCAGWKAEGEILVVCPHGFWRRGNVEVVCDMFNIPLYTSLEEMFEENLQDPMSYIARCARAGRHRL